MGGAIGTEETSCRKRCSAGEGGHATIDVERERWMLDYVPVEEFVLLPKNGMRRDEM